MAGLFLAFSVLYPAASSMGSQGRVLANLDNIPPRLNSPEVSVIAAYAKPGETMSVWGWEPHLYPYTGLIPATHETNTPFMINDAGQAAFLRARFLRDMRENIPVVFVDAVGPNRFAFTHRETEGHEISRELTSFVEQHYDLAKDVNGFRIYVLKSRMAQFAKPLTDANEGRTGPKILYDWRTRGTQTVLTLPPNFTIEAWIWPAYRQSAYATVLGNDDGSKSLTGLSFLSLRPGIYQLVFGSGQDFMPTPEIPMTPEVEHYVVISVEGRGVRVGVDGHLVSTAQMPRDLKAASTPFTIGDWALGGRPFDGDIRRVRITEGAMSEAEITQSAGGQLPFHYGKEH
jgi:hypothetical protein